MVEDVSQAIRQADAFHKNIALMFEDMCALVQEKGLSMEIRTLHAPEGSYWLQGKDSEHRHLFIFECLGKIRFIHIIAKVHDGKLRNKGTKYKAVCAQLCVDPVVPLIICWGTFEPRDVARFTQRDNKWLRWKWADNTVLLDVPDDGSITLADPTSYSMDSAVPIESEPETDSQYCEKATVKIRRLMEIHDSRDVESLVDGLLSM